jgi:SpoIID/LytB domain protein
MKFLIILLIIPISLLANNSKNINDLYKKSLTFNKQNIPIIKIGITETKKNIRAKALKNFKINKTIVKKNDEIKISYEIKNKGVYSLWLILDKYPEAIPPNLKLYQKYIDQLKDVKNKKLETVNIGNLSVINGNIIDIRKKLVIYGPFKDNVEAQKIKEKLYIDLRLKTEFYAKITKFPSSKILIKYNNKIIKRYDNILEIDANLLELINLDWGFIKKKEISLQARGKLIFTVNLNEELAVVNKIDIETLLKGIVPAEIFASAPEEALKAQAVAARSDILAKIGTRHFVDPYDICGNQHCQVYKGKTIENKKTNKAIIDTKGMVLTDKEGIIDAYYSANSGGYTENNENVWLARSRISLRGRDDFIDWENSGIFMVGITKGNLKSFIDSPPETYSQKSSYSRKGVFRWKTTYTTDKINDFIKEYLDSYKINKKCLLKDLKPNGRGVSGRLMALKVICEIPKNNFTVYGELQIRRFLGSLKSAMFYMNKTYENKKLSKIEFVGGGWGHGVGMCQTGAIGMAEYKKSFEDILTHYYTNSKLKKLYDI